MFGNPVSCFIRHCFFVDEFGRIIDPSIFFVFSDLEKKQHYLEYIPFALLEGKKYLSKIEENNLDLNLDKVLRKEEEKVYEWFANKQYPLEYESYQYLSTYDENREIKTVMIN